MTKGRWRAQRCLALATGVGLSVAALTACGPQRVIVGDSGTKPPDRTIDLSTAPAIWPQTVRPPVPTAPATPSSTATPGDPISRAPQVLRPGDSGTEVHKLQRALIALGYWLGEPDGEYGDLTEQAVLALQKVAGISRDGVFGARTRAALSKEVQPQPRRVVGAGIEIDLKRQVLMLAEKGKPTLILNTSTGSGATYRQNGADEVAITPTGKFSVYREVDGQDHGPLGDLWRPKYIVRGVAIHGYPYVPAVPASHGCIRVSNAGMDQLWAAGLLPIGASVWVY